MYHQHTTEKKELEQGGRTYEVLLLDYPGGETDDTGWTSAPSQEVYLREGGKAIGYAYCINHPNYSSGYSLFYDGVADGVAGTEGEAINKLITTHEERLGK